MPPCTLSPRRATTVGVGGLSRVSSTKTGQVNTRRSPESRRIAKRIPDRPCCLLEYRVKSEGTWACLYGAFAAASHDGDFKVKAEYMVRPMAINLLNATLNNIVQEGGIELYYSRRLTKILFLATVVTQQSC